MNLKALDAQALLPHDDSDRSIKARDDRQRLRQKSLADLKEAKSQKKAEWIEWFVTRSGIELLGGLF